MADQVGVSTLCGCVSCVSWGWRAQSVTADLARGDARSSLMSERSVGKAYVFWPPSRMGFASNVV
jgi:hypothetical protein